MAEDDEQTVGERAANEYRRLVVARTGIASRNLLQCPRERSFMTPCIARDGGTAVCIAEERSGDQRAICVGCEESVVTLLAAEWARQPTGPRDPRRRI
jgi:hypothetical protein